MINETLRSVFKQFTVLYLIFIVDYHHQFEMPFLSFTMGVMKIGPLSERTWFGGQDAIL